MGSLTYCRFPFNCKTRVVQPNKKKQQKLNDYIILGFFCLAKKKKLVNVNLAIKWRKNQYSGIEYDASYNSAFLNRISSKMLATNHNNIGDCLLFTFFYYNKYFFLLICTHMNRYQSYTSLQNLYSLVHNKEPVWDKKKLYI